MLARYVMPQLAIIISADKKHGSEQSFLSFHGSSEGNAVPHTSQRVLLSGSSLS